MQFTKFVTKSVAIAALCALPVGTASAAQQSGTPSAKPSVALSKTVTRSSRYLAECVAGNDVQRPERFTLTGGDGLESLEKLTWTSWGPRSAKASGVLTIRPTAAERGRAHSYPVTVRADRLRAGGHHRRYFTRLHISFTAKKAPGEQRTMLVTLPR